jgi:hypothetical protein
MNKQEAIEPVNSTRKDAVKKVMNATSYTKGAEAPEEAEVQE